MKGGGSVAQLTGAKSVGQSGLLIEGSVYLASKPQDIDEARDIYCRFVAQSTAHFPLHGVDVGASDPTVAQTRLSLANVYIDVGTTDLEVIQEGRKATRAEEVAGIHRTVPSRSREQANNANCLYRMTKNIRGIRPSAAFALKNTLGRQYGWDLPHH